MEQTESDRGTAQNRISSLPSVLGVALAAFAILLIGVFPFVYWADSGELIAGGFLLGLAHPPSFPVFALLIKASSFLPLGDVAFRASLASILPAALTTGLFFVLARGYFARPMSLGTLPPPRLASLGAAVACALFVLSPQSWGTLVRQEVYALHLLLTVGVLAFVLQFARSGLPRPLYLAGFLFGLAMGNHSLLTLALFPPIFLFLLSTHPRQLLSPRGLGVAVAAFLLGLSAYLYLPLRSATNPLLDWNDPQRWEGFVESFTKKSERALFVGESGLEPNLRLFAACLTDAFTPYLLVLLPLGLLPLWRRGRREALFFLALSGLNVYTLIMGPTVGEENPDAAGYLLLTWLLAAGCLGEGVRRLAQPALDRLPSRRQPLLAGVIGTGVVLTAFGLGSAHVPDQDDDRARAFGRLHLDYAPPGSLMVTKSDAVTFLTWYWQWVEGARPDVRVVNRRGLADPYYRFTLWQAEPGLFGPARAGVIQLAADPAELGLTLEARDPGDRTYTLARELQRFMAVALDQRPVLWEGGSDNAWVLPLSRPKGPLFEVKGHPVVLEQGDHQANFVFQARLLARMTPGHLTSDPRVGRAMDVVLLNLANALRREQVPPRGLILDAFKSLTEARPQLVPAGMNYGFELFARGDYAQAEAVFRRMLVLAPGKPAILANLGAAIARQGRMKEARQVFEEGLKLHPESPLLREYALKAGPP